VPPAYVNVRFSPDSAAHLQAVGEDAAGRLQYRYHPKWAEVREALKARRLAGIAKALPAVRRAVGRGLASAETDRRFAAACVVELVCLTAIRAGGEEYARERGTRGATTLLKSNVRLADRGRCAVLQGQGRQDDFQRGEEPAFPCRHCAPARTARPPPVPASRSLG
jgi:DNA topoisomerase-1